MHFLWIVAVAALWIGFGLVFLSLCKAAARADRTSAAQHPAARPLRQHLFALHVRSLRVVRHGLGLRSSNFVKSGRAGSHHPA